MNPDPTTLELIKKFIEESEIFAISRDADPFKYRNLEYELIEKLYEYMQLINPSRYRDMGLEIVETANACLQSYDKGRGPFLNYFISSLSRRVRKEEAARGIATVRGGIALPSGMQQKITIINELGRVMMRDINDIRVITAAADYLGITAEKVKELITLNDRYKILHDSPNDDNNVGAIYSLVDKFNLEDYILDQANVDTIFSAIDATFKRCRKSQQTVVSKILTSHLLSCPPDLICKASQYEFFDRSISDYYSQTDIIPTAREISFRLNKKEASTSRTFNIFMAKVKLYLNEKLKTGN